MALRFHLWTVAYIHIINAVVYKRDKSATIRVYFFILL